jgi:phosphatidylglycerophosphatase A
LLQMKIRRRMAENPPRRKTQNEEPFSTDIWQRVLYWIHSGCPGNICLDRNFSGLLFDIFLLASSSLCASSVCLISLTGVLASASISKNTGIKDPSYVVIDEVAGQLVTFLFLPVSALNLILGTIAFRLFDIWKPFPIRKLESLEDGVGVMADDLLAGVYANLVLQLINILI